MVEQRERRRLRIGAAAADRDQPALGFQPHLRIEGAVDTLKIKGIGDVYRWRLYRAGIYTWHQIAESAEETLRAATNAYPGSNIGDWQEQARQLAQKNGRQGAVYDGPSPDDLTKIIGIGPVGARTLFRAGICTYEQLAGATPAELHDLFPIAVAGDEPNFEHWVAQAADLAGRKTAK